VGKFHNQTPGGKRRSKAALCESCGLPMSPETSGCYEVTMITRIGPGKVADPDAPPRRVLWRLCSIMCVELFARGHTHLDTALGGYWGESEEEG
jgi:hypothetical protein